MPAHAAPLPAGCLLAAFYLNELLLRLTTRHDPQPELFDHYHRALERLRAGAPLAPALRVFEKRLLQLLGYGLDLATEAHSGKRIEPDGYYHFRPGEGLVRAGARERRALAGRSLLSLERETLERYARARGCAARAAGSPRGVPRGAAARDAGGGENHGAEGGAMTAGIDLGVNIDHVATLRQVRRGRYPDPVHAALAAESAGADNITLHLREDRRHIQDRDVRTLRSSAADAHEPGDGGDG